MTRKTATARKPRAVKPRAAKKVTAIKHGKQSRPNIPTAEMEGLVRKEENKPTKVFYPRKHSSKKNPEHYARTVDNEPQLVWKGKAEEDQERLTLEAVPIYTQEKINPQVIIQNLRRQMAKKRAEQTNENINLFQDFNGLPDDDARIEFYRHQQKWTNRMILGDSLLVMASLGYKEGLKGKVQCIYMDPPYGINFSSNWQVSTKTTKVSEETHEPEMIQAFRDTWKWGVNSYLSYLRDRLTVSHDLLTETGSVFVQISDENMHHVREIMDEVFGAKNFVATISYRTRGMITSGYLHSSNDYIVWYAKNAEYLKFRRLFIDKPWGEGSRYSWVEMPDGSRRRLTPDEKKGLVKLPKEARVFIPDKLSAMAYAESSYYKYSFEGKDFYPAASRSWQVARKGMDNLALKNRLIVPADTLCYVRYHDDYPVSEMSNVWNDTQGELDKNYVVQTSSKVVQRCLLMTTDPGDLVLDPTCGSGTTASIAEEWGRRWITIDTSRVALALARARLMGNHYPYYLMQDSEAGAKQESLLTGKLPTKQTFTENIQHGFVYKRVPHVTLESIANNASDTKTEFLVDQPYTDSKIVRVTGPFTVESLSPHRILPTDADDETLPRPKSQTENETAFMNIVFENLKTSGVQNTRKKERLEFSDIEPFPNSQVIQYKGIYQENGKEKKAAISVGPEYGTVTRSFLINAAREAADLFDTLIVLGFAFEAHADDKLAKLGRLDVIRARMNNDLHMADRLNSKNKNSNLFVSFGEPDIVVKPTADGEYEAEIRGIDIFDPTTGEVKSSSVEDIACWMIDTNYDEQSFFVRHIYFTGDGKDPIKQKLKTALKADIDPEIWQTLYAAKSQPFPAPTTGKIAIKAINHYGDEVLKVFPLPTKP